MRALVTGAAAGLGRAMTLELNRLGASVLALDRDAAGLAVLAGEGGAVAPLTLDLADRQAVLGAMDEIASFGPFDFVVLNAGISATGKFEEIPDTAHRAVLAVNAVAPMLIASGLASREACAPGCRLVFVSSLSHRTGYPGAASYAASKDCLAVYARGIARPFAAMGVHVTTAFPGPLRTGHAARHAPPGAREDRRMAPERAARIVLQAALRKRATCHPGMAAKAAAIAGSLFPGLADRLMRRNLFRRMDGGAW